MFVTNGTVVQKIDEGTYPYWAGLGWGIDNNRDGVVDSAGGGGSTDASALTGTLSDARLSSTAQAKLALAVAAATPAQITAAVAALVNGAPGALDTLAELAAALTADEGTAATLATLVGTKAATTALTAETNRALAAEALFGSNDLTTGQSIFDRGLIANVGQVLVNGQGKLTYFTSKKSETCTTIQTGCAGTAGVAPTLAKVAIFSIAGNGDGTLLAASASDTALWTAINTAYNKATSSPYAVVAGNRYAVMELVVGTTTAPILAGVAGAAIGGTLNSAAPRRSGHVASLADVPASFTAGSVVATNGLVYAECLP